MAGFWRSCIIIPAWRNPGRGIFVVVVTAEPARSPVRVVVLGGNRTIGLAEKQTANPFVVGSSPTAGANLKKNLA